MQKISFLKKLTYILLFIAFAFRPVYHLAYIVYYQLNIDYIIETYCVNKDKPELQCNGKCHLAKQIVKAGDSENGSEKNQSFSIEISIVYLQDTNLNYSFFSLKEQRLKVTSLYSNIYKYNYIDTIFHPPLV